MDASAGPGEWSSEHTAHAEGGAPTMLGILLLAVSSKIVYYTVLSAVVLMGIVYLVAHVLTERNGRA